MTLPDADKIAELVERFQKRDRRALARLISIVENGGAVPDAINALSIRSPAALRVGITGPGGAGKSTLCGKLAMHIRAQNKSIAIVACDPSSPISGGALLGDRVRMQQEAGDDDLYVRSLSSRGASGGVSASTSAVATLLDKFGFDVVLFETVGAGQDQLGVRDSVDVLVLVVTPAAGDEIQWEKAGLLEVADIVAVNKADLAGADAVCAGLRAMLDLSGAHLVDEVPILKLVATRGEGVEALWEAIESRPSADANSRGRNQIDRLIAAVTSFVLTSLRQDSSKASLASTARQFAEGTISLAQATKIALDSLDR